MLSVDLASTDHESLEDKELRQALLTRLSAQTGVDVNQIVNGNNENLTLLSDALNRVFSKQNLLAEFLLGQWIEVAYLQAQSINHVLKSAKSVTGDVSARVTSLNQLDGLLEILESADKNNKEVTQALLALQDLGKHSITGESVEHLSQQLLKLRTIWMVQPL